MPCSNDVVLHGAMLNTVECLKANEILRDTISKFRYMLHIVSLQEVSMNEREKNI